jgi:signal transduction histidine kinase
MRRNPFFRRLGCAFAAFNIFGLTIFFLAAVWVANLIGLTRLPASLSPWVFLAGLVLLLLTVLVIILGIFGLRRVFNPLDDLLEAAGRVADGDYAARVPERGSPEIRSLARAFNDMASRLNVTDEMRRNLQADVTHELRTPLTVIRGNLEGMLDGIYPPDETNLRALLDETNFLSRLIEDLRTVALAESGTLKLKKEPTDLVMLVRDTLTAFQSQADAARVRLSIETPDESQQEETRFITNLEIDPVRMRQVLSNLVANALRYTPAGGCVQVKCGWYHDQALLEVTDDGPGIAPEDLPYVFERFYKSTDSGGMGLGLAIARHLVSAHGGSIEAHRASGHGTTIRILLPAN